MARGSLAAEVGQLEEICDDQRFSLTLRRFLEPVVFWEASLTDSIGAANADPPLVASGHSALEACRALLGKLQKAKQADKVIVTKTRAEVVPPP